MTDWILSSSRQSIITPSIHPQHYGQFQFKNCICYCFIKLLNIYIYILYSKQAQNILLVFIFHSDPHEWNKEMRKDLDELYTTKSKTTGQFWENIIDLDYQNIAKPCLAYQYNIYKYIMQTRQFLECEEASQRQKTDIIQRNYNIPQVLEEEKIDNKDELTESNKRQETV